MKKRGLVTGGTRGIGKAVAELLAASGYEIIVTGTSDKGSAPAGCSYLPCDFSDSKATENFAAKVADMELSILINNAGINKVAPVTEYAREDFETLFRVNVEAPFLLCRAVVPGMCRRRYGRIINITSVFGHVSKAGRAAYSTGKFGLYGLTKALALEVAKENVLVNCVAPGFIDTELTRKILGSEGMKAMAEKVPMGRLGKPEEIAAFVQFLASEANTYMTGQAVVIDGGFTSE